MTLNYDYTAYLTESSVTQQTFVVEASEDHQKPKVFF